MVAFPIKEKYNDEKLSENKAVIGMKETSDGFRFWSIYSLDYLDEWRKSYSGPVIAFEYHFWRHYNYSISGQLQARILYDDVKAYGQNNFEGIIQCGSQRALFPNALRIYTFAMAMYDGKLSYEEIEEDLEWQQK